MSLTGYYNYTITYAISSDCVDDTQLINNPLSLIITIALDKLSFKRPKQTTTSLATA